MRKNYIEPNIYYMALAQLSALQSKDPQLQVGAVIVNSKGRVVSTGYNHVPNSFDQKKVPWTQTAGDWLKTKLPYISHAEEDAILNTNFREVLQARIYTTMFPCASCARLIVQSGIREVYFLTDSATKIPEFKKNLAFSRQLLTQAQVKLISMANLRKTIKETISEAF